MSSADLIEAIDEGDFERVRDMLALEPALARSRDADGVSALLHARYRFMADDDVVDVIREHAEPLDAFEAATFGVADRLAALLDADPELLDAPSADGFHLLHLAAFFGQPSTVELVLTRGADVHAVAGNATKVQPLHSAVAGRNEECVALVLEYGADLDGRQHGGWTAMHAAAKNGDGDIVDMLMDGGADAGLASDDGTRVGQLARQSGHDELARRLGA